MSINRWIILSIAIYGFICVLLYLFASATIISVVFRLLNFTLMIAITVFVFYRKLYPTTKKIMHQEELKKEALTIRQDELIDEQKQLKKKMEAQDQECQYLLGKIDKWRDSFDERQRRYKTEREQAHMRSQKKAEVQSEWLGQTLAYDHIVKEAVDLVNEDLKKRFSDKKEQQEYIKQLVNFMRKNIS